MRISLVVATLFVILLVLFTGDPASSQIGGNVDTDTVLTIPSNLTDGDSVTVTSSTTFAVGPVFGGQTTFYHLDDIRVKGDTDFGASLSLTDPTFQFDISSSMTLRSIRIPITFISTDAVIHWNISENVGPVLAEGEININEQLYMQQQGNLMLVIGSLQSDDLNNDNKYSSGISLTSGSYKITLSQTLTLDFVSKASSTFQGVYAYENDILQNAYPQLYLMGGSHRERINTVNGVASSTFSVSGGTSYVLAYYGDGELNFSPSHELKRIDVATNSPLTVSMIDYQSTPGSSVSFTANVMNGITPVVGATVDFSALLNNILTPIGLASTNSAGDALIFYLADLAPGNYSIYAEAFYSAQYGIISSELSLSQPTASWSNMQANAEFGSAGLGITSVTVDGTIKTQRGTPIVNDFIEIRGDGTVLQTVSSDSNGDFSYTYLVNFIVGTYTDYYTANITDGFWDGTTINIDLVISRGQLLVNTNDVNMEFIDQPAHITGTVTNIPGEDVMSTIYLDKETSPSVWATIDTEYSDNFDFTLQSQSAGSYNYRVRIGETAHWTSVLQPVLVSIGPSNAAISRGLLPTTFDIQYHQDADLSAYALKEDLSPIEGADVKITVWDPALEANIVVANGLTDSNGLVVLSWMPSDSYLSLPGLGIPMTYTATHNDFVITDLQVFFTIIESDVSLSLVENVWIYDTSNTIVFDTLDQFGFVVNQGTQIDVTIEGTTYTMTIDAAGQGRITHRFANVGSASMSVVTTDINPFPYNSYSDTLLYTVNKGDFIITGSNKLVARGGSYSFTSIISDHNGIQLSNPVVVNLWLFDVTWINLGQVSSINNVAILVDIMLNEGIYTIEWRIDGDALYNGASQAYLLTVEKSATEILFSQVPTSYNFNDESVNREVTLVMRIPVINEVLANQFISIDFVSIDDSYSWFLQTDANGEVNFTLPQQPITGSYTLTASFSENADYQPTSSTTGITVVGVDTILSWNVLPTDGYYAEDQIFSLHAVDVYGNDLVGFTVDLTIGTDTFSVITNSSGDATFTINMLYEESVDLNFVLQAKGGWNSQSIGTTIQIEKKQLVISSEINSIMYSPTNNDQDLDIAILVASNNDPYLVNIKLELYWLNPTSGTFELVDIYYTDNGGYLYATLTFPSIDAAQSYVFNWIATDTNFLSTQFDQYYAVTPMLLDVAINYTSGNYMELSPIDFVVRDDNGMLMSGLDVYMGYTEIILLWSDTVTTSFGTATIDFYAPSVGELSVYFRVSDTDGNYIINDGNIIITINPAEIIMDYSLDDDQGTVTLVLDVRNQENLVIGEGIVVIESWQGVWITEKTISLSQTNSYELNMYSDTMQFRVSYLANSHYDGSITTFNLFKQNLIVNPSPFDMEVNNALPVDIELQGNSSLNDYLVEIYIYDSVLDQWLNHGNLYTSNGIINDSLPVNLDIGTYQIRVVIPEQGWYKLFDQTYTLNINFNHFTFEIINTQFRGGINNNLEVRINSTAPDVVTNVQLDLYITVDSNKIHLGTAFTNSSGIAIFSFNPTQSYGIYTFEVESTETTLIKATSFDFQGIIGFTPNADFTIVDTIDFDQGGIVTVRLTDHSGQILNNTQVDVFYSLFNSVTQSYEEPNFFITLISNSTGHISITIPTSILQTNTIQLSISLKDQLIIGNTFFTYNVEVSQIVPTITYLIDDRGVSQYATITVIVMNTLNESVSGDISWKLVLGINIPIEEGYGSFSLIDGKYQFMFQISAIYIGNFEMVLDYHDTSNFQKYLDTSVYFDLGWTPVDAMISSTSSNIMYQSTSSTSTISFTVSDVQDYHMLAGISVTLSIDGNTYTGITNSSGIVLFQLNIIPGTYSINLEILSSQLVNDAQFFLEVEILKGFSPIILNFPQDYGEIAPSITLEIDDSLIYTEFEKDYNVLVYRDNQLVTDSNWTIEGAFITIYPSDDIAHLYPGIYRVELTRYHPYYTNTTAIQEFIISPLTVKFNVKIVTINSTDYISISFDNNTAVDVEFLAMLRNIDLNNETEFISNTQLISIPWNDGRVMITVNGTGYVEGFASLFYDIPTSQNYNNTTSSNNSTRVLNNSGIESMLSVNSIQVIGIFVMISSAAVAPARKYLGRRK